MNPLERALLVCAPPSPGTRRGENVSQFLPLPVQPPPAGAVADLFLNDLALARELVEPEENFFASLFQARDLLNQLPAVRFRCGSSLSKHEGKFVQVACLECDATSESNKRGRLANAETLGKPTRQAAPAA
jgi:hypothetical protein